jgi:hypothetical protein
MQRSSSLIASLAAALAKAQAELVNPEKSQVATIRRKGEGGPNRHSAMHRRQPLSLVSRAADAVARVESADRHGHVSASARTVRRGRRAWHVWKLVAREPGDPTSDQPLKVAPSSFCLEMAHPPWEPATELKSWRSSVFLIQPFLLMSQASLGEPVSQISVGE